MDNVLPTIPEEVFNDLPEPARESPYQTEHSAGATGFGIEFHVHADDTAFMRPVDKIDEKQSSTYQRVVEKGTPIKLRPMQLALAFELARRGLLTRSNFVEAARRIEK